MSYTKRIECWENTVKISELMAKPRSSVKTVYKKQSLKKQYSQSNVRFFNMDTIDCAIKCNEINPLILNLSDDYYAGGYVSSGSGAQEESIFRRTNYCQSLLQDYYPILNNEAVYSPDISVIKSSEATKWTPIPDNEVPQFCFIACPALKYPETITKKKEDKLLPEDVEILKNKIRLIIQTAIENKHDTIIFGAMGCGAWRNPVKHVAEIFKYVLNECNGVILNYYFAILTTQDDVYQFRKRERTSVEIFSDVFGLPVSQL